MLELKNVPIRLLEAFWSASKSCCIKTCGPKWACWRGFHGAKCSHLCCSPRGGKRSHLEKVAARSGSFVQLNTSFQSQKGVRRVHTAAVGLSTDGGKLRKSQVRIPEVLKMFMSCRWAHKTKANFSFSFYGEVPLSKQFVANITAVGARFWMEITTLFLKIKNLQQIGCLPII